MSPACPKFGFHVLATFTGGAGARERAAFERAWAEFLDRRGLVSEGAGTGARLARTVFGDGTQATDADRAAVRDWLGSRPEVAEAVVGDLADFGEER
ncbi:MAG TPA: 50S ribosome-binding protein YggL [Gemmatimonadaceae bacterium]|nr:50S ribosome-binding protein YggL [Gemmatimonadaceae bacterium]